MKSKEMPNLMWMAVRKWMSPVLYCAIVFFIPATHVEGQPAKPMVIAELSYLYTGYVAGVNEINRGARIVLAINDTMNTQMSNTIIKAMNRQWGSNLPAQKMVIEQGEGFFGGVKKMKVKSKQLDEKLLHIFFRVIDEGAAGYYHPAMSRLKYTIECKVYDGNSGNTPYARTMSFELEKPAAPTGQYALHRVPALPAEFLLSFDSAVSQFFTSPNSGPLTFAVKPVCLLINDSIAKTIRHPLLFDVNGNNLRQTAGVGFAWALGKDSREKLGKVDKTMDNVFGSLFTAATGLKTDKVRLFRYRSQLEMIDAGDSSRYLFIVPYLEEEREERTRTTTRNSDGSKSRSVETTGAGYAVRYVDKVTPSWLVQGVDTIATFSLEYGMADVFADNYNQCWDGEDSATIIPMPSFWSNKGTYLAIHVTGTLYGKPFVIQNSKDGFQMDVYYDNVHVATLRVVDDKPRDGMMYKNDLEPKVLKTLAMFTCLPYSYFQNTKSQ